MIIYKCVITGDEMFSDIYKITETKDGMFYEVEGKMTTRTESIDDSLLGANASADEVSEGVSDAAVSGVDIVLNHKLQETFYNKKSYVPDIKAYTKAIKTYLEQNNAGRVDQFMKDAPTAVKSIVSKLDDLRFFTGESMNAEGMVALLDYREDGMTPYMLFFKDGLEVEKC